MGKPIHTTTEHKIGTVTYLVVSAPSEDAAETLDKKVEKLIRKDMRETAAKRRFIVTLTAEYGIITLSTLYLLSDCQKGVSHVTVRQDYSPLLQT